MTAKSSIDPAEFLHEHLSQASPDLLRELMQGFVNTLLSADADSVCGAAYGVRDAARTNSRNGYRHRDLDTRIGTLDVAIPKLREGSYFPEWLLERRRRAEAALTSVVATCYLLGVSTRRVSGRHQWRVRAECSARKSVRRFRDTECRRACSWPRPRAE
jgi:transposase-like protein